MSTTSPTTMSIPTVVARRRRRTIEAALRRKRFDRWMNDFHYRFAAPMTVLACTGAAAIVITVVKILVDGGI